MRKKRSYGGGGPVMLAVYGVLGWIAYSMFKNRASAATGAPSSSGYDYSDWNLLSSTAPPSAATVSAPAPLPGTGAPTSAQIVQAVTFWDTLAPTDPPASGYINFPSGSQSAASLFRYGNTRMDNSGNLYVSWAGQVYQLANTPDTQGNWPALLVS